MNQDEVIDLTIQGLTLETELEMHAMIAENQQRRVLDQSMAYIYDDFMVLQQTYHNAMMKLLKTKMEESNG